MAIDSDAAILHAERDLLRAVVVLARAHAAAGWPERATGLVQEVLALSRRGLGAPNRFGLDGPAALETHAEGAPHPANPLSPRECQVLTMLSRGLSSKEMSTELCISIGTVKSYRRTLYGKLRISTRSGAVAAAHRLSLSR